MDANAATSTNQRHPTNRSQPQPQQHDAEPTNRDDGSVPPSAEYEAVAKDRFYNRRVRMLGIRDSLLRPVPPLPTGEGWFDGLPWPGRRPRALGELTSGGWRPTRAGFELRWPDGEVDSVWYENVYSHLYLRVWGVAKEYFGFGDLPDVGGGPGSVWLDAGFSTQFMWFVEQIAMQDNRTGGWDELLVKQLHRTCLVTGVIGKALETCVFDDLLFGADETQKKMLEGQDECTLELEGEFRLIVLRSGWESGSASNSAQATTEPNCALDA